MGGDAELPSADRKAGEDHAGGDSRNEDAVRSLQAADMNKCRFVEGVPDAVFEKPGFSAVISLHIRR